MEDSMVELVVGLEWLREFLGQLKKSLFGLKCCDVGF
jgi:hypothetical protein